jgi:signal transduction histidine kinase
MNYVFKKESINLGDLIYTRADICKKLYINPEDEHKQPFSFVIEDDVVAVVDKYYITQVIDNIIINSIQYCKEGNITITLKSNQETVEFSVCDQGIGVPEEELVDIFGAFTVSSVTRTPAGGRGVGLAVCEKIIELHGGTISAKQNKGKGITVTFVLPRS